MITVLIPIAPTETVHPDTDRSIREQDCGATWIALTTPFDYADREPLRARRRNEIANRNLLLQHASTPYACYCDSDVVFSSNHDLSDCINFLKENLEYDAVALNTKIGSCIAYNEKIRHVCVACLVIRTERWQNYVWQACEDRCACIDANRKFTIKYLDARQLTEKR